MSSRRISNLIGREDRRRLQVFSGLRILANVLDLLGILGIAILANTFGSLAFGQGSVSEIEVPILGVRVITEFEALIVAASVAAIFVLKSAFTVLLNLRTSVTVARIESRLSNQLAEGFFGTEEFRKQDSVSSFQSKAIQSTVGIRNFLNSRVTLISELALLASMVLVFIIVNPIAASVMIAFMGLVLTILNLLIRTRTVRASESQVAGHNQSLQASRDLFGVAREARASGVTQVWIDKFRSGRSQMALGGAHAYTLNSLPRFVIETSLILGIFLFIGGVVIFSDLASEAVTIGVFLAGGLRVIAAVIPLQGAIIQMRSGAAMGLLAIETLEKLNQRTKFDPKQVRLSSSVGLSFAGVSYKYPESEDLVLRHVSFDIEPLTKVAIVGPSGAGKSTIFDLAMGFIVPDKGEVFIDGQTSRSVLTGCPGAVGLVPQRPHLVSGSVLENVSLLNDGETVAERVKEVLVRVGLEKLTVGSDWHRAQISPDLEQLSGGEIQRLSLARALYKNPKILFLDEATSSLDAETELQISKVLDDMRKDMTIVLIAHRLSTVMQADKLIYLDKGLIVAQGSFSELQAKVDDFSKAVKLMNLGE